MEKSLVEIAEYLGGEIVGDGGMVIRGFAGIQEAKSGDLTFLSNPKYVSLLGETQASAILVSSKEKIQTDKTIVRVDNPSLAFSRVLSLFVEKSPETFAGIHPTAVISEAARISDNVTVGPHAVIESGVKIGEGSSIGAGVFIGFGTCIGENCLIYPNVTIRERNIIGNRVIIHSGTVIGSDGFGYVTEQGIHEKIPQIGIVEIQDDVEIGANVAVDRARFDKTFIGRGTKIDNLVQIAHNVRIGKNCIIVSQVGISGSTTIEDYVVLGGQVGVAGHLTIGAGTMVAAKSGIPSSVPPRSILFGSPAQPHMQAKRMSAALIKLPEYIHVIRKLEKKVEELERKIAGK
ncbi:MAG: UDP-3-O-(3-hydroxymyristoyl)glucosamine N-acyltransferase [Candidatus Omnitrophota bacterium]